MEASFWAVPYRPDGPDAHNSMYGNWQEPENDNLFGEYVDFDAETPALSSGAFTSPDEGSIPATLGTASSTASEDLDFMAAQFQTVSEGNIVQPGNGVGDIVYALPRASISESELPKLDGMTLRSPVKNRHRTTVSDPNSPTPPNTARKVPGSSNKFMEKLSSTIRKATGRRGRTTEREDVEVERGVSPTMDMPILKNRKTRAPAPAMIKTEEAQQTFIAPAVNYVQTSPQQQQAASMSFAPQPAFLDDPFVEGSPTAGHVQHLPPRYFSANTTPLESPVGNEFFGSHQNTDPIPQNPNWGQQDGWSQQGWWDMNVAAQNQNQQIPFSQQQRHASFSGQPTANGANFQYQSLHDPAAGGLMIQNQMPISPMTVQAPNPGALVVDGQTYLPPPIPASEPRARARAPRAKSSGARHLSLSPTRKTPRQDSSSPSRRTSRQSSGSSVRSASGKMPGDMPGTPCSVKKRRSRDVSLGGGSNSGGGISLDNGGFVNFTPSDGGVLMTGVAPSGSSKTKARREKEAMEKRRRMSEAAMRAVEAAGGDVDKFIQQGFSY